MTLADREALRRLANAALWLGDPLLPPVGAVVRVYSGRLRTLGVVVEVVGNAGDGLVRPLRKSWVKIRCDLREEGSSGTILRQFPFPLTPKALELLELPPDVPPLELWLRAEAEPEPDA